MKKIDMTHGSLWDKILMIALPLAASGILQQLFNAADVAVVGQFVGKEAMAAVGANAPVVNILITMFTGISLGANVVISRYTGRKDKENAENAAHTAILVAVISGFFILVLGQCIARITLEMMFVPDDCLDMAVLYLRVYLCGMPVIFLYNFEAAIFQSQGDTKTPLMCLIISGIVNVILNLFFVIVIGMTVNGVALATVISNGISSMLLFAFLLKGKTPLTIEKQRFRIHADLLKEMLQIGLPAGLQGMVFSISNILIQSAVNSLGTDVVAGSSAAGNLEIIGYFVVNSFSQACTTIIGQNFGANQPERCHKTLMISLVESWIVGGTVSFLIIIFGKQLLRLFNSDPNVIAFGYQRLFWILSFEVINGTIDIISGAMRGYGESLTPALIALVCICGVRIVYIFTYFAFHRSFTTLMLAYPISWIITVIVISAAYLIMRKNGLGYQQETTLKDFKK
ncbi:MAG: MATE family efflux transporter [Erysipelotrichaceae bacterium]|nr:MATE family efflux transporter [Erysipelotrichaceae bacterium]MDD7057931.1 MATE family efflux transporter [Erysipelotrichaceae bacterium]